MPNCLSCGKKLVRVHRTRRERWLYAAAYECRHCRARQQQGHWYSFLFGDISHCPRCGTHRVQRLRDVDRIDRMYRNPISYLQKFFGGNLHRCSYCRLQFYDVRDVAPKQKVIGDTEPIPTADTPTQAND